MDFEWDQDKHLKNLRERGIGFDDAALALEDVIDTWEDRRHNYGEVRVIARCRYEGEILIILYTDRGDVRRIISARRANKRERGNL